jgi:hypothetical protein
MKDMFLWTTGNKQKDSRMKSKSLNSGIVRYTEMPQSDPKLAVYSNNSGLKSYF